MSLAYIESLGSLGMKFDLGRIKRVLSYMGQPHQAFPSIHIAGSNGKGSVAAMISQSLYRKGIKVGLYTSPHLIRLNERFQINGKMISTTELESLIRKVRTGLSSCDLRGIRLTQYEFLTVVAFLWFRRHKIDLAVVETGLGGRLDATNVLSRVLASVITNISFEHTDWLGHTISKIAYEKAGIIKPHIPVVTGASGIALKKINKVANRFETRVISIQKNKKWKGRLLQLQGPHQSHNASIAYEALKIVSAHFNLSRKNNWYQTIQQATWPGRFDEITLKNNKKVILDAAHNPAAIKALLKTLEIRNIHRFDLLWGVLKDKDYTAMIRMLEPYVRVCGVVGLGTNRSSDPVEMARNPIWKNKSIGFSNLGKAWSHMSSQVQNVPLVVCGSIYLVGDVMAHIQSKEKSRPASWHHTLN